MPLRLWFLRALACLVALGGVQLATMRPAAADITRLCLGYTACANAGMSSSGYAAANRTMYWRMYSGHNCTNYAAYRMVHSGLPNTRPWTGSGNATNWGSAMSSITNQTPTVGAVAWWKAYVSPAGSAGHVAYVERVVSPTEIIVSQDSWGGDFSWARIYKTGRGWPSGFVHFNDVRLVNSAMPTVTGTAKVGSTLTATAGTWSQTGITLGYQWKADGVVLTGATAPSLTLAPAQQGKKISVTVTASKAGFPRATATSAATVAVIAAVLANPTKPAVTGSPQVGQLLTASPGTWTPTPTTLTYQWLADGVALTGATAPTLTLAPAQQGKKISVTVTAAESGYPTTAATSPPTTAVVAGALANPTKPAVTGTPQVGQPLTATPGTWSPAPTSLTYQWLADGTAVPAATAATLTPDAALVGKTLSLQVTAARTGYARTTSVVATAAPVAPGVLSAVTAPVLSGTVGYGRTLSVSTGSVTPQATPTVQWLRYGRPIAGATAPTYRISADDLGTRVSARVTWKRAGFTTIAQPTAATSYIKSVPVLSVTTTPGAGRLAATIRVTAPGVRSVPGVVRIRSGGKLLSQLTLRNGVASTTIRGLAPGTRVFRFKYLYSAQVYRGSLERTLRIR